MCSSLNSSKGTPAGRVSTLTHPRLDTKMEATDVTGHLKVFLSVFQLNRNALSEHVKKDVLADIMHSVFQTAFDKVEGLGRECICHSISRKVTSRIKNFLKRRNREGMVTFHSGGLSVGWCSQLGCSASSQAVQKKRQLMR